MKGFPREHKKRLPSVEEKRVIATRLLRFRRKRRGSSAGGCRQKTSMKMIKKMSFLGGRTAFASRQTTVRACGNTRCLPSRHPLPIIGTIL
jgi:hypothetical protein